MSYGAFAKYYDELTENISYAARADYFDEIIKSVGTSGKILLDLACGTGSLSLELAGRGYDVIGVDASPEMLSAAMQKQSLSLEDAPEKNNVLFLCQQMQELDLYGTIDVAICALDSINHITNKAVLQKVFDKISLFLNPEGLFVFDVNSIYKHEKILANQVFVFDREDVYCVWQNSELLAENIIKISLDFFEYDKQENAYFRTSEQFCERAYSHDEICTFLKNSGLDLIACYSDDTLEQVNKNTQRIIYVSKSKKNNLNF